MDITSAILVGAAIYGIFKKKPKDKHPRQPAPIEQPVENEGPEGSGQIERSESLPEKTEALTQHIKRANPRLEDQIRVEVADAIAEASQFSGLSLVDLTALVQLESRFNPNARSSSGAIGLGQLMPTTASDLGVSNPEDPYQNAKGAAQYLLQCMKPYSDRSDALSLALASYRIGPGAVSRALANDIPILEDPVVADYLSRFQSIRSTLNHLQ